VTGGEPSAAPEPTTSAGTTAGPAKPVARSLPAELLQTDPAILADSVRGSATVDGVSLRADRRR
jgi:hypothetical protein